MRKTITILLLSALSALGQMGQPTIITYPVVPVRFEGVTIDVLVNGSPVHTSAGLSFTLQAVVSPITQFDFQWQDVPGNPGSVTFSSPASTTTTVTVSAPGSYDFSAHIQRSTRFLNNDFAVQVVATTNLPPTVSAIGNQSTNQNTTIGPLPFTVADDTTPVSSLTYAFQSSNPVLLPVANITLGGSGANRSLTLVPVAGRSGVSTVTYIVSDNNNLQTTNSFIATWLAVNTPPTLTGPSTISTPRNTPTTASYTVGDLESPGSLVFSVSSSPFAALVTSGTGPSRTITVTPNLNAYGTNVVTAQVTDGVFATTLPITLSVTYVNYPPVVSSIPASSTSQDVPRTLNFTATDLDTTNLIYTGSSLITNLVPNSGITFGGTGTNRTITITPRIGVSGSTVITYIVSDGSLSVTNSFNFNITAAVNTPPTISSIGNQTIPEDGTTNLVFTVGDAETPAGSLIVSVTSISDISIVDISGIVLGGSGANRTVMATPKLNAHGAATITMVVQDGGGLTATNIWTLTVTSVNDCPVSPQIAAQSTQEDVAKAVAFSATDADGDVLSATGTSSNTSLVSNDASHITFGGIAPNYTVTLTPLLNQTGQTTIAVVINDGVGCLITNSFLFSVAPVNDPPAISAIGPQSTSEDTTTSTINFNISDLETPVGSLTVSAVSSVPSLVQSFNFGGSAGARTLTITPALNQNGSANISVSVSDGTNTTSTSFALTVTAVNDPPTIQAISNQVVPAASSSVVASFTVNDVDTALTSLTPSATTSNPGVLPLSNVVFGGSAGNRTVTFTPISVGVATVTVSISDGSLSATTPSFTVTKQAAANTVPVIAGLTATQTSLEDHTTGPVSFYVNDAETAPASLLLSVTSSNPTLVPVSSITFGGSGTNRTITLNPALHQFGTSSIQVTVTDGGGLTAANTFNAVWLFTNYPPVVSAIGPQQMNENTTLDVAFTVSDVETTPAALSYAATYSVPSLISSSTYSGNGNARNLHIVPVANAFGSTVVTNSVSDGTNTTRVTFTLAINSVNSLPTITIPYANTNVTTNQVFSISPITVGDVETPAGSLVLSALTSNPSLVPVGNIVFGGSGSSRTVTITPVNNVTGSATLTFIVTDSASPPGQSSVSFTVTVTGGSGGGPTGIFVGAPNSSPPGNDSNSGTDQNHPWTLTKAITGGVVASGKTVWILPGTYVGANNGNPNGVTFRGLEPRMDLPHAVFDRQLAACAPDQQDAPAAINHGNWANCILRDVEIRNSVPRCQLASGENYQRPDCLQNLNGQPNGNIFYNLFLRDGENNNVWQFHSAGNGDEMRGSISLYGGMPASFEGGGMGGCFYAQNVSGGTPVKFTDNIMGEGFNRLGELNGTNPDGPQDNIIWNGNIGIGGGYPGCYKVGCSMGSGMIFGTFNNNRDITVVNNVVYTWLQNTGNYSPSRAGGGMAFGVVNGTPFTHSNYLVSNNIVCGSFAFTIVNPVNSTYRNNTFISGQYEVARASLGLASGYSISGHTYYKAASGDAQWQGTAASESNATIIGGPPTGTWIRKKVIADPNGESPKLMNLTIFNWSRSTAPINVDLTTDDFGTPYMVDGKTFVMYYALNPLVIYHSGTKNGQVAVPVNTGFALLNPACNPFWEDVQHNPANCDPVDAPYTAGEPGGGGRAGTTLPEFLSLRVVKTN